MERRRKRKTSSCFSRLHAKQPVLATNGLTSWHKRARTVRPPTRKRKSSSVRSGMQRDQEAPRGANGPGAEQKRGGDARPVFDYMAYTFPHQPLGVTQPVPLQNWQISLGRRPTVPVSRSPVKRSPLPMQCPKTSQNINLWRGPVG